jgi:uncharacterized protein (TIGR02271 family)
MSNTRTFENIRTGMEVYSADERLVGMVEGLPPTGLHVNGRPLSREVVARIAGNRVYLHEASDQIELEIPVAEERLNVEKRQAELGEVQLRKTVEQEQVSVPVELQREEVHVNQRDVADRPVQAGDQVFQEGTIRVPVRGEEAVVSKQAVVTGEVVIEKERTTERQQITDTVRRERVEVDEQYTQHRSGFQQHFGQRQQQAGGRSWEEAEPNYQYGYMAARNNQYQGRQFEDVESDLRSDYQQRFGGQSGQTSTGGTGGTSSTGTGGGSDMWERLREEVREGWTRARGGR